MKSQSISIQYRENNFGLEQLGESQLSSRLKAGPLEVQIEHIAALPVPVGHAPMNRPAENVNRAWQQSGLTRKISCEV